MSLRKLAEDIRIAANELEMTGNFKFASIMDNVYRVVIAQDMQAAGAAPQMDMGMPMPGGTPQPGPSFETGVNASVQQALSQQAGAPSMPGMQLPSQTMQADPAQSIAPEMALQAVETLKTMSDSFGEVKSILMRSGLTLKEVSVLQKKIDGALAHVEGVLSGNPTDDKAGDTSTTADDDSSDNKVAEM